MPPFASLLATACVHKALVESNLRPEAGIIVSSGEVREVMHAALLLGYGATAVNPWLALQSITELSRTGKLSCDAVTAAGNYVRALDKGLLKIMSKLGISTLRSYRSAQAFEALGLSRDFINEFTRYCVAHRWCRGEARSSRCRRTLGSIASRFPYVAAGWGV